MLTTKSTFKCTWILQFRIKNLQKSQFILQWKQYCSYNTLIFPLPQSLSATVEAIGAPRTNDYTEIQCVEKKYTKRQKKAHSFDECQFLTILLSWRCNYFK